MKQHLYFLPATLAILLILSLALAACGSEITTGPTRNDQLVIPLAANGGPTGPYNLTLQTHYASASFGTAGENLVEGNFLYNAPELKPAVVTGTNATSVTEPAIEGALPEEAKTEWKFKFNGSVPLNLDFETDAPSGAYDLGGLSLEGLTYKQGGGDSRLYFNQPNRVDLQNLNVETTSGKLLVAGLSGVRLKTAAFFCKQGDLSLDFFKDNGKLDRPIDKVLVKGEQSTLTLYTSPIPAEIILDAGEQTQVLAGNWTKSGRTYRNPAWGLAAAGDYKLTIHVELNGGHLYLY